MGDTNDVSEPHSRDNRARTQNDKHKNVLTRIEETKTHRSNGRGDEHVRQGTYDEIRTHRFDCKNDSTKRTSKGCDNTRCTCCGKKTVTKSRDVSVTLEQR